MSINIKDVRLLAFAMSADSAGGINERQEVIEKWLATHNVQVGEEEVTEEESWRHYLVVYNLAPGAGIPSASVGRLFIKFKSHIDIHEVEKHLKNKNHQRTALVTHFIELTKEEYDAGNVEEDV